MTHYNEKLKYRSKDELSKLKLTQLKELCSINKLRKTGNKLELIQRLYEYYKD